MLLENDLISKLKSEHAVACFDIWKNVQTQYAFPVGGDWDTQKLRFEIQNHHGFGIFSKNGELVAFCVYRLASNIREILCLATKVSQQRRGTMRRLIQSVLGGLAQDEVVWLEVHEENKPAIEFYKRMGFQQTGRRSRYYSDGKDALLFEYKPLQ